MGRVSEITYGLATDRAWPVKLLLAGAAPLMLFPAVAAGQASGTDARVVETYESAAVDVDGSLVITTSDRRVVRVPLEGEQSSFAAPVLSPSRTAVGAQAEFPNCCTSYDIPLQLVVYADGKVHRLTGNGLPIFRWHFADGGTRVAFGQEPVHFGCSIHYELVDVASEGTIGSFEAPEPCGQQPEPPVVAVPKWVSELDSDTR
jgi:hypothetical protein